MEEKHKLVVCIMGQNCEKFLPMCVESVKDADAIVYCDGGSKDASKELALGYNADLIENTYDQEDKGMNGKQRNFYLKYLKENYKNHWVLCLDADEVVEDLSKIKKVIQRMPCGLYSVKMRHLVGDLGHEDSTVPEHHVLNRLFHINAVTSYPEVEHPVLEPKDPQGIQSMTNETTIWHLAYIPNLWTYKTRYENHVNKSNMHTPEYLKQWYFAHMFGQYPRTPINLIELPEIILREFGIDKDEFYFANRSLETRHFHMAKQWYDHFKPKKVLELGCGLGPYGIPFKYYGAEYKGMELSKYAVGKNPLGLDIVQGDITEKQYFKDYDLVMAVDILEHLEKKDLNKVFNYLTTYGKEFLFSIPFIGDPNLELDPTHKIKETKEWWINKLSEKFQITEAPSNWLFHNQLLIGKLK